MRFLIFPNSQHKLTKSIETVNKDVENINITTEKITKKFETISNVNINLENSLEVAKREEIEEGEAKILLTLEDGIRKEYSKVINR